ncbi:hypothetical protein ABE571_10430 [Stenotrophomonas sp. TWI273]|uniref:hypothetical protein n=1 Tax=Stenotrophomonas sp. TWI273 TaxID=3136774 RepID=UPI00320B8024
MPLAVCDVGIFNGSREDAPAVSCVAFWDVFVAGPGTFAGGIVLGTADRAVVVAVQRFEAGVGLAQVAGACVGQTHVEALQVLVDVFLFVDMTVVVAVGLGITLFAEGLELGPADAVGAVGGELCEEGGGGRRGGGGLAGRLREDGRGQHQGHQGSGERDDLHGGSPGERTVTVRGRGCATREGLAWIGATVPVTLMSSVSGRHPILIANDSQYEIFTGAVMGRNEHSRRGVGCVRGGGGSRPAAGTTRGRVSRAAWSG